MTMVPSNILSLQLLFAVSFFGISFSSFAPSPTTPSLTNTCNALQKATAALGFTCTTNSDCTSVTCNATPIPSLSASVTMSFTLKKCRKPVQLVVYISVPIAGYKYSYAFEGAQTIALPNVPSYLSLLIGTPYVHVQVEGVQGGVKLSAGIWLKRLFSTDYTRYSLIKEQFIPLDISTCPSIATGTLPSKFANFHDYSDYDSDSIADALKKWFGNIGNLIPTKRPPGPTKRPGPTKALQPTSTPEPVLGALPTDIYQLMKLNPSFKKCVDDASVKFFGVTFDQLEKVQEGIIPTGFHVPPDSDDDVDEFANAAVVCGINHAMNQNSFSLTPGPFTSIYDQLDQLVEDSEIQECAKEVLLEYNIKEDAISPSLSPVQTMDVERGLLQCFYGQNKHGNDGNNDNTKWIIIGASVGGAVLIAVIVAIILFSVYMKRRVPASGVSYRQLASPN